MYTIIEAENSFLRLRSKVGKKDFLKRHSTHTKNIVSKISGTHFSESLSLGNKSLFLKNQQFCWIINEARNRYSRDAITFIPSYVVDVVGHRPGRFCSQGGFVTFPWYTLFRFKIYSLKKSGNFPEFWKWCLQKFQSFCYIGVTGKLIKIAKFSRSIKRTFL